MKTMSIVKTLINTIANLFIFGLAVQLLMTLSLAMLQVNIANYIPAGSELVFTATDSLVGFPVFTALLVVANALMIFGLHHFKNFVRGFEKEQLFTAETISFLRKASLLVLVVDGLTAIMTATPNYFHLNINLAVTLFLVSLAFGYIKKNYLTTA